MTTKARVARELAKRLDMSRKDSLAAVDSVVDCLRESLLRGEKVSLVGFGAFEVKIRQGRQGRNPRTSEKIAIPPKAMMSFRPGKAFREAVKEKGARPAEED
jgi:DNA-binding protein HU-beta